VTPLVYKPGRRWVAREERTDGSAALVKVHRRSAVAGVLAGHAALTGLPVVTVAEARERRGTVRHPWLPGRPLDALVGPGLPDLWSCAGAVLAAVHAQPSAEGLQRVDRAVELAAAVAAVRAVAPFDLAAAAASTAERVLAQAGEAVSPRVVHGDFSADQVLARPDPAPHDRHEKHVVHVLGERLADHLARVLQRARPVDAAGLQHLVHPFTAPAVMPATR